MDARELERETGTSDVELPEGCAGCGGRVLIRFSPGVSRGVCLNCHLVTAMSLVRAGNGVKLVQAPAGTA